MLEAISRSVWRCEDPEEGCTRLTRLNLDSLNSVLDNAVPNPFKYIMFEAIALFDQPYVGVRGYHDKQRGLTPWSLMASLDGAMLLDARDPLIVDDRVYGLSGATYDAQQKGFWLTWSHEAENISTRKSVSGLLTFSPLQVAKNKQGESKKAAASTLEYGKTRIQHRDATQFKICAHFQLKPEGVSVSETGMLFVVFDEDLDRKSDEENHQGQYFPLLNNQDYVYTASVERLMSDCR